MMNSREKILNAICAAKPALTPLPVIKTEQVIEYDDVVSQFRNILESIGGQTLELNGAAAAVALIRDEMQSGRQIIDMVSHNDGAKEDLYGLTAIDLSNVEKAFIMGDVGVAENGAVWLYESCMGNRLLPFICQHLVLVLEKKRLCATMHKAYEQIDISRNGYGVFIAGPSKTADIEQSLVIGAHGARSLTVVLI